jgi:exopolyphosphatase/guanosine-5'-triphosphate,3'-diphosphate pyrophosphatase
MAELSEVTAGSRSARTIAVEAEDPELVAATVRELQLAARPNVCLARGLKTLVASSRVRFAVIDVGTNSVKLHVGERRADGSWQTVSDRAEVTRLGEGLQESGALQPEPMRRTAEASSAWSRRPTRGAAEIAAVATAGMRLAENSRRARRAVRERCGVGIEVISGEEEAGSRTSRRRRRSTSARSRSSSSTPAAAAREFTFGRPAG